jgi:class 3 adenylate cyclase
LSLGDGAGQVHGRQRDPEHQGACELDMGRPPIDQLTLCARWTGCSAAQGGDYFGRTVNLAAPIAAHARPGQVLVSQSVVESASPESVSFVELQELRLKGFARPVRLLEACRA